MYVFLALFPIVLALILMTGFKFSPGKALPLALIVTAVTGLWFWKRVRLPMRVPMKN